MSMTTAGRRSPAAYTILATIALTTALPLVGACWRERSTTGPAGPLALDRVMGRFSEREGTAGRAVTFDGAGGTTFIFKDWGGRVFAAHGTYWLAGDTVRADYEFGGHRRARFAFWALPRGDSLIVYTPGEPKPPPSMFPPLVRDPPDE